MTIRAKLYTAIVLTILGPLATTAVALHGMSQMGDRFDEVERARQDEALARELKFGVTDMNGWQTAYGYDDGRSAAAVRRARRPSCGGSSTSAADTRFTDAARARAARAARRASSTGSWPSTWSPGARSRRATPERTKGILLGPELRALRGDGGHRRATSPPTRRERDRDARRAFDDARDDARRRLIAVALGAGLVIVLLLVTANDIARMALEGERTIAAASRREPARRRSRDPRRAPDAEPAAQRGAGGTLPGQPAAGSRRSCCWCSSAPCSARRCST